MKCKICKKELEGKGICEACFITESYPKKIISGISIYEIEREMGKLGNDIENMNLTLMEIKNALINFKIRGFKLKSTKN